MMPALHTPYAHLVPPLAPEEQRALTLSIEKFGQPDPVVIDERGNILVGHDYYLLIGTQVRTRTIAGLTEAEKRALVVNSDARTRRNLTEQQKQELHQVERRIARDLRAENPTKNTPAMLAEQFGVTDAVIASWLDEAPPALKSKYPSELRATALARMQAGEPVTHVARALGVPRQRVSEWLNEMLRARPELAPPPRPPQTNGRGSAHPSIDDTRTEALRRLHAGEASKVIARELGIASSTLSGWRSAAGIAPRRVMGPPKPARIERRQAVLELHKEGLGTTEIARKLGVGQSAISNQKSRLGIASTSVRVKLWADVDHIATLLEGTELTMSALVERLATTELHAEQPEMNRCISSLSKSKRTLVLLISVLKQQRR